MGTALYKALREAGVSDETATAAADDSDPHLRLSRMETAIAELRVSVRIGLALLLALLAIELAPLLVG